MRPTLIVVGLALTFVYFQNCAPLKANLNSNSSSDSDNHHNHDGDPNIPFVQEPVNYCDPAIYPCVLGNGSTAQGGTAPAYSNQPPIIPSNFSTDSWLASKTAFPIYDGFEAKFRTHCNHSHHAYDDPIVFPKQPGGSHLHTFFGNTEANADSTYSSLRQTGSSTCGGGRLNRSAYWYPSVLKDNALGDGKTMVIKPAHAVVYYNVGSTEIAQISPIPRGLTYVFGVNMGDPADSAIKAEIPFGYVYNNNGFAGWACLSGGGYFPYLRNPDGSAAFNCPAGTPIKAALFSPTCWDGKNLTSPNGRKHVRHLIRNRNTGGNVCPTGWYKIAQFELFIVFDNPLGPSDYKDWYLSSDHMASSWTGSDCHGDGNGRAFCNGESMHTDWFGAWDWDIMTTWMIHCNGTTIPTGPDNPNGTPPNPHTCGDTGFGDGRKGLVGHISPDTGQPQLNLNTPRWTATSRFDPLPPTN